MLKIVKASEPMLVERINICIYSPPGLGKSTLAFTAEDPVLFDCDKGAYRAKNRGDVIPVDKWADMAEMTPAELAPYKTVIVDTAGRALDFLSVDIIAKNAKMGFGGALTLQGYGQLKARFSAWLKMLRTFGKDVILIAHMDEQRNGDEVIERLDVQGGSKGEIYKSVDAMGRLFMKGQDRLLDFNPRENSFGKNPCDLPVMPFPLGKTDMLAGVMAMIKDRLNKSVELSKDADRELQDWTIAINDCSTIEELNALLPEIRKAAVAIRFLAQRRAKELHLTYDQKSQIYKPDNVPVGAAR